VDISDSASKAAVGKQKTKKLKRAVAAPARAFKGANEGILQNVEKVRGGSAS